MPASRFILSRYVLTEQVFVEYAVEVKVPSASHVGLVVCEVAAEVALEVVLHVTKDVRLKVPESM